MTLFIHIEPFQSEPKQPKLNKKKTKKKLIYHFSLANIPPGDQPTFAYDFPRCFAYRSHRRGGAGRRTLIRPKKKTNGWICGSLKIWRFFFLDTGHLIWQMAIVSSSFWRFLTDGWLNIFEKSFGEIGEVFKDRRNGVQHPGLNWENDDPQHSAPTKVFWVPLAGVGPSHLDGSFRVEVHPPPQDSTADFF